MDFDLTKEQKDIARAAGEFAEGEFPDLARECDREERYPMELVRKAAGLGFIGVNLPEAYGGTGYGYLEKCLVCEAFWRVDPGLGSVLISATFGADMILLFGNEAQKKTWLQPLTCGQAVMGSAITEPDAGSDVASTRTEARAAEDGYIIDGSKMFITNGTVGSYFVVLCLTDPDNPSRHRRHSVILVERDRPGFEANKLRHKLGIRASDTAELVFKTVRVPKDHLIGEEGQGFYQFMHFFNLTRIHVGAEGVGIAQGALDRAIRHLKTRHQFGHPLGAYQANQFKVAEMATRIHAARNMVYEAAFRADQGRPDHTLTAMAKWYAGETCTYTAQEALQIHGGYGYFAEYDIERFYRDAKIIEIYEGTKEIEKIIIARSLL
ncbi:Acryloyl-CoA reductase (NADH) [uncultured Desulfatiglans sp.]|uniref:Acryloyl-CoA reductase (NADH) n=1 Tax=Uncultured Desulfatiglans sp. TaxID=1748965 RepID=A0A653A4N1_UNCDX|nr:Acryloyl-CoA reductase (NADH) [uncultured Desulfatiglans sp.]